jgi:hypothetical protein
MKQAATLEINYQCLCLLTLPRCIDASDWLLQLCRLINSMEATTLMIPTYMCDQLKACTSCTLLALLQAVEAAARNVKHGAHHVESAAHGTQRSAREEL